MMNYMRWGDEISFKEKKNVGEKAKATLDIATSSANPNGNRGSTFTHVLPESYA